MNPIAQLIERQNRFVIDGGLATTLQARGYDLDDPLWSARLLLDDPAAIRDVHLEFLAAGADCITSASYQASVPGFRARGLSEDEAAGLLRRSVELAIEARDVFWAEPKNRQARQMPLVAASVGPYGAYLADGSEYTGDYEVDAQGLYEFHADRWHILTACGADVMACETIPSKAEARVLMRLVGETPDALAWMSFSCQDGTRINDGAAVADVVRECDAVDGVIAVGINCTSPRFVSPLIQCSHPATAKPIIVYPNSGERYDATHGAWTGNVGDMDWPAAAVLWLRDGASGIGGCCRVSPTQIRQIREAILPLV